MQLGFEPRESCVVTSSHRCHQDSMTGNSMQEQQWDSELCPTDPGQVDYATGGHVCGKRRALGKSDKKQKEEEKGYPQRAYTGPVVFKYFLSYETISSIKILQCNSRIKRSTNQFKITDTRLVQTLHR